MMTGLAMVTMGSILGKTELTWGGVIAVCTSVVGYAFARTLLKRGSIR